MMLSRLIMIALFSALAACGGGAELTCDDGPYKSAVRAARVQSPEGLDALAETKEMPLPAAAPSQPRPADAPCIDRPPSVITSG